MGAGGSRRIRLLLHPSSVHDGSGRRKLTSIGPQAIALSSTQLQELERLARASLPNESCAFLLGKSGDSVRVEEILPVKNVQATRVAFEVPADELLKAYDYAERSGLQVAGIFHSHPAAPAPSGTDRRFMEINPVVWVIYSTTEGRFAAWIFDDDVRPVKMI